jgi:hypothetical protein
MRSIGSCLNKNLAELYQHSRQLKEWSEAILPLLPAHFAAECRVGNFNKGCLLLTTTEATWASQLRYMVPELRDKIRKETTLHQLSSIKIMVVDVSPKQYQKNDLQPSCKLSAKAKAIIMSGSQQCSYEPLQRALVHLAQGED